MSGRRMAPCTLLLGAAVLALCQVSFVSAAQEPVNTQRHQRLQTMSPSDLMMTGNRQSQHKMSSRQAHFMGASRLRDHGTEDLGLPSKQVPPAEESTASSSALHQHDPSFQPAVFSRRSLNHKHSKSLKGVPALTDTSLCPHFGRAHHRHGKGAPRASVAVFASCPVVCHFNTTMVDLTLSSFFKHLHIPANTNVFLAHTPGGTPECIEYEAKLRRWAEAYNSCYFISKSLPDAYLKVAGMTSDPYILMLEHDWYLVPIKHTLADLMRAMDADPSINQIRFNQQGFNEGLDGPAIDITRADVPLAITPHHWSNNPAVVRTDFLRYRLSLIMEAEEGGSAGIEHPWIRKLGGKFDDTLISWFTAGLALYGHSKQSPSSYIVHLDTKATTCDYEDRVVRHMASLMPASQG